MESKGNGGRAALRNSHLKILRFGRTRPVHCKKCRDKSSLPKVSSWMRGEYRLMVTHSTADEGVCQHHDYYPHGPGKWFTTLTLASSATSEKHRVRGRSEFRRRQRQLSEGSENAQHVRASTANIRRSSLLGRCGSDVTRHSRTHWNNSGTNNGLAGLIELLDIVSYERLSDPLWAGKGVSDELELNVRSFFKVSGTAGTHRSILCRGHPSAIHGKNV